MSLAMTAASFDNDNNDNDNNNIHKKRIAQNHNRTQKKFPDQIVDNQKVNQVLQSIHNNTAAEEMSNLGDFNPPEKPVSSGVKRAEVMRESMTNNNNNNNNNNKSLLGVQPTPSEEYGDEKLAVNNFKENYGSDQTAHEYYKRFIPNFTNIPQPPTVRQYQPQYQQPQHHSPLLEERSPNQELLIEKLNYMIHLLEEQHDEKTHSVTEEVILYSFLGIFIIFIVDSFSRIGKYTR